VSFPLESFARHCLLNGVDELGFLLAHESEISAFERRRSVA
jgi:3-isopropylmalate/(R)-2-methylmalate dehydratase small subunit